MPIDKIKIGTRGSPLALRQTHWVQEVLKREFPYIEIEIVPIKTTGDKIQDVPLAAVGGKGLFIKEIEEALLDRRIDLAVHSMKDMPGELPPGLVIGAVPVREDPRDVLISRDHLLFNDLPRGGIIGTSSLRRKAQLRYRRPDLQVIALRGNLDTRLKKMETEGLAGIILAAAGIHRLGLKERVSQYLDREFCLPAVGQGALALEIREEDTSLNNLIGVIHHEDTSLCTRAERAFLSRLQGGCQIPVAGHAWIEGGRIRLRGLVAELEGREIIGDQLDAPLNESISLGTALAEKILQRGGRELLEGLAGPEGIT